MLSKKNLKAGFTFTEILVGIGVLGILSVAIFNILHIVLTTIGESRVRTVATALGQERLELIRNLPYNNVGTINGIPSGSLEQTENITVNDVAFTLQTSVVYIDDPFDDLAPIDTQNTDYKRTRVSISWGGAFPSRSPLVFITDVSPQGLETEANGGTLSVLIFNAAGEPVQDAEVTIINNKINPPVDLTINTNSQGNVFLPGAQVCIECYEISVTKNGFSTDRTYSTSEVANPQKPHITLIEGEISEISFAIDQLSSLTVKATSSRQAGYLPFSGVEFILRGSKIIGTNTLDESIYKYEETLITGSGGYITLSDMEWDTYNISLPNGSSVDFAGSNPINPFTLNPGSTSETTFVTTTATNNSLLVIVTDEADLPLASADVNLATGSFEATQSTGLSTVGDFGQTIFTNLVPDTYILTVTLTSYEIATSAIGVSGDTKETIVLSSQ